jgi:hypothetical protein
MSVEIQMSLLAFVYKNGTFVNNEVSESLH